MNVSSFLQDDRYLSAPDSALVINPFPFEAAAPAVSQADIADRPSLPLSIGLCFPTPPQGLGACFADACLVYERRDGALQPHTFFDTVLTEDCAFDEPDHVRAAALAEDGLHIGIDPASIHPNEHTVRLRLPRCPSSCLLVGETAFLASGSKYSLALREENGSTHHLLYTTHPGAFGFWLDEYTDLSVDRPLYLDICVHEGSGHVLTLSSLRLLQLHPAVRAAASFSRRWRPTELNSSAAYAGGSHAVLTDRLAAPRTVERRVRYRSAVGLVLAGRCDGAALLSPDTLYLSAGGAKWKLHFSAPLSLRFYSSAAAFYSGDGSKTPTAQTVFWSAELPPSENSATVSLLFTEASGAAEKIEPPYVRRRAFFRFLDRVPVPVRFVLGELPDFPSLQEITRAYFSAWAQLWADILPAGKTNSGYACVTTGKASLWGYGAPKTPYAASWETFYGLMLLSFPDPDCAWDMFADYMRQTDENGRIGGESLPSVKARTARLLFSHKPDRDRLRKVLPALERYLNWRLHNLRWIYLNRTPNREEKDIDFVVAALRDMADLTELCRELHLEDKAAAWQQRADTLFSAFSTWFFPSGSAPVQYFRADTGKHIAGIPLVVTKALCLPQLLPNQRQALLALFDRTFDPARPFCGFDHVKMENMSYTLHGLCLSGRHETARRLAAVTVRDILRSGCFAEEYVTFDGVPQPAGVRPALFGCVLLIDCLWFLSRPENDPSPFLLT